MLCYFIGVCVLGTSVGAFSHEARAEPLTAQRLIELVKTRAPEVLVASTRVAEARGRLSGARALGSENPTIEAVRGSARDLDHSNEIALTVPIGIGLRRSRQVAEARAGLDQEAHFLVDTQRRAIGMALAAYYQVLHAERRLAIARDRRELAEELNRIAGERLRTGDAARLELLVAETELSRAESEVLSEERNVAQTRVTLAGILGLPSGTAIEMAGDLSDRTLFDSVSPSSEPERRADVLAAESAVRAASAAVSLAKMTLIPELSFRMNYQYAGDESVVRPGFSVSLPIFNYGQGVRGEAKARRERATIELEAQRAAALAEAEGARTAYQSMAASAREIEERALPRATEVEALARQGYEAGKIDLSTFLVVRSNALETLREHADRLLQTALAGIELATSVGALP
jgi:cobalt-zinc-cadmium efflux system outer membrane protein